MASEIDELRSLILGVEGEALALQAVVISLFDGLLKAGVVPRNVIEDALSQADLVAEVTALKAGKHGHPVHTAQFLEVVRYMRAEILGE